MKNIRGTKQERAEARIKFQMASEHYSKKVCELLRVIDAETEKTASPYLADLITRARDEAELLDQLIQGARAYQQTT